jgi:hypothetical protein
MVILGFYLFRARFYPAVVKPPQGYIKTHACTAVDAESPAPPERH